MTLVAVQPYKYNGKEFITMHGNDVYDFNFRSYYPAMGRFTSVDPLAETTPGVSPYAYCMGNPSLPHDCIVWQVRYPRMANCHTIQSCGSGGKWLGCCRCYCWMDGYSKCRCTDIRYFQSYWLVRNWYWCCRLWSI